MSRVSGSPSRTAARLHLSKGSQHQPSLGTRPPLPQFVPHLALVRYTIHGPTVHRLTTRELSHKRVSRRTSVPVTSGKSFFFQSKILVPMGSSSRACTTIIARTFYQKLLAATSASFCEISLVTREFYFATLHNFPSGELLSFLNPPPICSILRNGGVLCCVACYHRDPVFASLLSC